MSTPSTTVIGAGNIGSAVAALAVKAGSSTQVLVRDSSKASVDGATVETLGADVTGDVVVLALPYDALAEVVAQYGEQLKGKTLVDVSNPIDFTTFDSVVATSAAEELAAKLPAAQVVKAFNTNFAASLASGEADGRPTTVMAASDSAEGKAALRAVVEAAGLSFVDAGALKRAQRLEAIGALQIELAMSGQIGWTGGLIVTK